MGPPACASGYATATEPPARPSSGMPAASCAMIMQDTDSSPRRWLGLPPASFTSPSACPGPTPPVITPRRRGVYSVSLILEKAGKPALLRWALLSAHRQAGTVPRHSTRRRALMQCPQSNVKNLTGTVVNWINPGLRAAGQLRRWAWLPRAGLQGMCGIANEGRELGDADRTPFRAMCRCRVA